MRANPATWTTSWMASQQPVWAAGSLPLPTGVPETIDDATVIQRARISVGGRRVQLVLSNQYGPHPVHLGAASVMGPAMRPVTFAGLPAVTVPAGGTVTSDPVDGDVSALGTLSVCLYLPRPTKLASFHWDGRQTAYIVPGNQVSRPALEQARTFQARVLLAAIDGIRTSGAFDAVADFDAAVRDPAHPDRLLPAFDSGDHLHPGDQGYAAMAAAIAAVQLP